jgi:hypothetical protein
MTAMMIEAALRALVFAIAVGAGLRALGVQNVPVRKTAWSVVLIGSLAMPLLMRWPAAAELSGRFSWVVPIRAQQTAVTRAKTILPAPVLVVGSDDSSQDPASSSTAISVAPIPEAATSPATIPQPPRRWPAPGRLVAMIYLAVAGALMLRLVWGLGMALRLWVAAEPVSPLIAPEPNVRSSSKIPSPVTIGSGIVLPANYLDWDMKMLRVVLAHERSHVRQLDFYLQLLAGVYTALFWFSPLGWWLRRTLCMLGETIGDRAGLDAAATRSGYAEVLLEFAATPRRNLPGVAMARSGNLSRRIEQLLNEHHFRSAFAVGRRRALASLLLLPLALFAATALIRVPRVDAQAAPPAAATAPAPDAAAHDEAAPNTEDPNVTVAPGPIQTTPPPPSAPASSPAEPMPPAPPPALGKGTATSVLNSGDSVTVSGPDADAPISSDGQSANGYAYVFSDNGDSYALIEGSGNEFTFSGGWNENRKAEIEAARKVAKGPFLWFTHDGKSYVVTDPAVVAKIRAIYKPMEELGREQGLLGKQQEALGKQQEAMARAQDEAGNIKLPDLSKQMAELDAALVKAKVEQEIWNSKQLADVEAKLKADQDKMLTPDKIAEIQAKVAAVQAELTPERMAQIEEKLAEIEARLGDLQGEAGARQGDFGAKMGELGAQQGELGAQQGKLGAEQGRLAQQADRQVRSIIEESLRNGKATQVPDVHSPQGSEVKGPGEVE